MEEKVKYSLWFPKHMKQVLTIIAKANERTLPQQIIFILRSFVGDWLTNNQWALEEYPEAKECYQCWLHKKTHGDDTN